MKLTITIDLGNAAFDPEPGPEVARILAKLAGEIREDYELGSHPRMLRDVNGNRVGTMRVIRDLGE